MVRKLAERYPDHRVFEEGFYSPVELAWCAYVDEDTYQELLKKYPLYQIEENTYTEEDHRIICYTKIGTDDRAFYQDLERYEIYNNRKTLEEFESIILNRYRRWQGSDSIFECSLFQNIVEELILYKQLSDEQILSFYQEIRNVLDQKDFKIIYLKSDDIADTIAHVRKERTDGEGNEVWFHLLCDFFNVSPYALNHGLKDEEGIIGHLRHRQELELRICQEIFPERSILLESKKYDDDLLKQTGILS